MYPRQGRRSASFDIVIFRTVQLGRVGKAKVKTVRASGVGSRQPGIRWTGVAAPRCGPQVLLDAPLADSCNRAVAPLQGRLSREPEPPPRHLRAGPDVVTTSACA